ncbi:hypothetical protein NAT51_15985 [Flavobacterium amniphilum]|uniref:hypothetical protein n=1 Tax=Flavobacterium amniphilum TaxID=1834035 RepID=UPI00202A4299|nr:hypothetical protein [Flavobacterium amniphilum]MCL9807035.1 hypothetical protein [Flavobacterium amniphilum]
MKLSLFFLLFTLAGFGQNDLYKKHTDSLTSLNSQLLLCVKNNPKFEVDCRKEYFHIIKDMEKELFSDIRQTMTGEEAKKFQAEENAWTDSSYWYYSTTFKWFKEKHPTESILRPSDKSKADSIKVQNDNAAYVKKRIEVLLEMVKK